jgi:hypothetical protein
MSNITQNKNNVVAEQPLLMTSGIDALQYFIESNEEYDNLYLDILDQLDMAKGLFERNELMYRYEDLKVTINDTPFEYAGNAEGFLWFRDIEHFVRIGFKDEQKNRGLHNIRVQFEANGIYTIGITSLIEFVDNVLHEYITDNKPITRVDINAFVQYNFNWIDSSWFLSRQTRYVTYADKYGGIAFTGTLYIGKQPFLLRLYDKRIELKNSKKEDLMKEYFLNHGFDLEEPLFNVEFQIHRDYLKSFKIKTVDDLLEQVEALFKDSMQRIRMIDKTNIDEKLLFSKNRNRAETHPIWQQISDQYNITEFMQTKLSVERIKRKTYTYTENEAIRDHLELAKKARMYGVLLDKPFYEEVEKRFKQSLFAPKEENPNKDAIPVTFVDKDGLTTDKKYQFSNGMLRDELLPTGLEATPNEELLVYLQTIERKIQQLNDSDASEFSRYMNISRHVKSIFDKRNIDISTIMGGA